MSENVIIGYDTVGIQKFPRYSGPCKRCGAINYGQSTSGPDYCGACACGTPVEVIKLRRELSEVTDKFIDADLAVGLLTTHFPPFNEHTQKRAESYLAKRKADWEKKNPLTKLAHP